MALKVVRFVGLFLSGIITGIYVHGVLSSASTKRLSGPAFAEMSQELIPDFTRIMPIVGMSSLLTDILALLLDRKVRSRPFRFTVAALALNIGATVSTVRLNVPVNQEMQTWKRDALPPHWCQTRDRWLTGSKVRTALGLLDLSCLILATQSDSKRGETSAPS
ncbi:MAG: anthrone oxygenase family protein [Thermomicrobiales bacterium]